MKNKIAQITIPVPYKSAGNVISQHNVSFDVYRDTSKYYLIPQLSENELRLANLPEELIFTIVNNKPKSSRGDKDGNFHVIQDAFDKMKLLNLL